MEDAARGFSFMRDGPLDMRLDPAGPTTAADLVNTLPEQELAEILRDMGEEPSWRAIARKLVEERKSSPITTTGRLASTVRSVASQRGGPPRIDPATRTFQALRIVVNDELGSLRSLLEAVLRAAAILGRTDSVASSTSRPLWLAPAARVGVISFHSLEDRLVKQEFGELHKRGAGRELTRKPVEASEEEVSGNPRSRSAKLRVVEIIGSTARVV
jgi:16S rRNA (cytosine1402-N4)-methyltransferase